MAYVRDNGPGLSTCERTNYLEAYTRLMAPLLFPQLYPACGYVTHSEIPSNVTKARHLSNSQDGEDLLLFDALFHKDAEPGTFLEIGALDGKKYSNTSLASMNTRLAGKES